MKKLANNAAHKTNRQKHGNNGKSGGQHRQANFLCAFERCLVVAFAHLHMAHDVFPHHDGIVDQQAHTQAQRHQSHHVDGEAKQVHEQKRANNRNRQSQPGNDGGAPGVQKQKHNQHRQQCAFNQGTAHVVHRHTNRPRAVSNQFQAHTGRQLGGEFSNRLVQPIDHADGVFILRFLHTQQQRALTVVERQTAYFLRAILDKGDLVQRDGSACLASHNDFSEVFRTLDAGIDFDHALLRQRANCAQRQVLVFIAHRSGNLVSADTQRFHGLWVQINIDFSPGAACQGHSTRAAHIFQALFQNLVSPVGEGNRRHRRLTRATGLLRSRQHRNRPDRACSRVKAQHPRLPHLIAQQRAQGSDFFAHILGCTAAIYRQLKLDDDHRLAFIAARGQRIDASDGVDAFLDFFGDFAFDNFGRSAGVFGGDNHHRKIDARKLVHLHALVRKNAQHHNGQHDHDCKHRILQTDAGKPHGMKRVKLGWVDLWHGGKAHFHPFPKHTHG